MSFQHASKLLSRNGILLKFVNKSQSENQLKSLAVDSTPQELYKSSLACTEVMLMHLSDQENETEAINEEDLKDVGKLIISFVFTLKQDEFPESDFINIVTSCHSCLKFIAQADIEFSSEYIGELLGISKSFMLYSIPDINQQAPSKIVSSQQAIMEPVALRPNKRGNAMAPKARKPRKPNKKKTETTGKQQEDSLRSYGTQDTRHNFLHVNSFSAYKTSDSDYSDNEHNREYVNRHKQSKLRLAALSLLSVIAITVEKKILFGYWHSLFSTEETLSATLVNCVLKDSSPRCRILALQLIIQLLRNSKPFLIQAENKEKAPTTFTPFSATLGNMIVFTYDKLTQALIKESDLTVLTQILKCISIFIPATPFHRLKPGIVTGFVKYVRQLTRHKDPTIKVAALIVMGNLLSITDMTSEIYELLEIPKSKIEFSWKILDDSLKSVGHNKMDDDEIVDLEFEDEEAEEEDLKPEAEIIKMSWLLQAILENLGVFNGILKTPSPATSVRIESLQVLSAISSHFLLLKNHLPSISFAIVKSLQNSNDEQMYASRAIDVLGSSINIYLSQEKRNLQDLEASVSFWLNVIPNVVERIQDNRQPAILRASLADGLANIGVHVFEKLDHHKQILLISLLTGCSYDDDANVKSSAIRALAVYVLFPSLRDDLCYVENTIESILRIIKDPNVLTRTKVSWSLSQVVDALLIVKETKSINEKLLQQIYETSLEATTDNDRVKVNAVRTIGNLMTLLTREQIKKESWLKLFEKSVQNLHNLLLNCGNVKVKWNVCYSLSSLMKNSIFFEPGFKFKWQELVFPALCDIIRTSPNFKVRINACAAFTIPSREKFSGYFFDVWSCLVLALEQSNNLTDFNEYKHRDTLQDQLCSSICHIINVSTVDDVVQMKNVVFPLIDITKQNWNRVYNRWLPECQGKIFTGVASLKSLNCKTSEQKNSVEILVSCFQPIEQF